MLSTREILLSQTFPRVVITNFGQELMTRSAQLPCARVMAFSQTSLFLERFWREF